MLFAIYVCHALTHGCQLIANATQTPNQAQCVASAQMLDRGVKNHEITSFRCAKFVGPNVVIPM